MKLSRLFVVVGAIAILLAVSAVCFRPCRFFCQHMRIRTAGGSVDVRSSVPNGRRAAIFDNPATSGCWVHLNGADVDDGNVAMLDCYDGLHLLDLSNTKVTVAGLKSLPSMRMYQALVATRPAR